MPVTSRDRVLLAILAALLVSCGSDINTTNTWTLAKFAGDGQSGTVGTAVAIRPAVKITDKNNAAVASATVTFAVASGGGSITGGTVVTGADGVATVGSWTLGSSAGANTLSASSTGANGSPVTFTATATALPVATAMTKQAGDAQTAVVGTAVAVAPAVKLVDASGNPVAGVAGAFAVVTGGGSVTGASATTNALGIATVGSWTVGATAGANTLTATATGSGITGNPATFTATGTASAFSPSTNTTLSGVQNFASVNIPAGVTVTMTGDLTLNVSGAVTIAGTLSGDCVNLSMTITGAYNATGNVSNGCSTAPTTPPSMVIVAQGGYHITSGHYTLGGSLNLTNDATLSDATFPAPPAPLRLPTATASLTQAGVCSVFAADFIANPLTAKPGTPGGQTGGTGGSGSTWTLQCTGELDLMGLVTVQGQNGGAGGIGTHTTGSGAFATGGNGGKGGTIQVRANNGDLVLNGSGNEIRSGDGGAGGNATATATAVGNPGGSATSTGGNGNGPGNIVLQSRNGGVNIASGLTLTMGSGGIGGSGTSLAADGQGPCTPGVGGAATATGGIGGTTPAATLTATGSVAGLGNVTVAGGAAGTGGAAKATSGTGGNGAKACKPGATGGAATATGGKGGDAQVKNATGALIANGGQGGSMEDVIGKGGNGYTDCVVPFDAGGPGGAGGAAGGKNGAGGTGLQNGAAGAATFTTVSDGGNGGNGMGPGAGGAAGANVATLTVAANTIQPSFIPGTPGAWCAVSKTAVISIANPITDDPSNHESVLQLVGSRAATVSTTGALTGIFPGVGQITLSCSYNATSGVITCTQSGFTYAARTITQATFTGSWNETTQQLIGDLVLTIQGQANTVKYHIVDP